MAHTKRLKSGYRIERDQRLKKRNKENRKRKWLRDRERWSNDEKYQKKQAERIAKLKSKPGYKKNIEEGKIKKEKNKQEKILKQKRLGEIKAKKLPNWAK